MKRDVKLNNIFAKRSLGFTLTLWIVITFIQSCVIEKRFVFVTFAGW